MALIVEDGSIVAGANTYVTVSGADDYFDLYVDSRWTATAATDAKKEAAIYKGMRYLEGLNWKGTTVSGMETQPLQWPRQDVKDRDDVAVSEDVVPDQVVWALCEAAVRSLHSDNQLQPDLYRGGKVSAERVSTISRAYQRNAPSGTTITVIEDILFGLLKSKNFIPIVRS